MNINYWTDTYGKIDWYDPLINRRDELLGFFKSENN